MLLLADTVDCCVNSSTADSSPCGSDHTRASFDALQGADLDGDPQPAYKPSTASSEAPTLLTLGLRCAAFLAVLFALWKLFAAHS